MEGGIARNKKKGGRERWGVGGKRFLCETKKNFKIFFHVLKLKKNFFLKILRIG